MTTHTDAPADDLGNCPECGLPTRECTALTMARLAASEYLEDNAGLSRHAAKARALELIPERAKPRPADDLGWLARLADPNHVVALETARLVDQPDLDAAIARIRSLEAQVQAARSYEAHDWWKAVIGGKYQPSGAIPSIKHLHPTTLKEVFDRHAGTEVADVICALLFKMTITENREQFLTEFERERANKAEAQRDEAVVEMEKIAGIPIPMEDDVAWKYVHLAKRTARAFLDSLTEKR